MHGWPSRGLGGDQLLSLMSREKILPEDCVPLAELDLVPLLQAHELPPYKGVIEGVLIRCDEAPPPIHVQTC